MTKEHEIELKNEIAHIFDSGANEIRIFEMVKMFLDRQEEAINYTHSCKSDSEQLMQSCSVCGMHKHPILGANCKASNCPNEH